jgi:hypothetical protein
VTRLVVACAGVLLVSLSASGSAVLATTTPGLLYVKQLVITNEKILVQGHKTRALTDRAQRYKRGVLIRYEVRNGGTHGFRLNILGSSTGMLAPGRRALILVGWTRRGNFTFRAVPDGPRMRVVVY